MSPVERGVKRRCLSCEAMFYDMLRFPIRCPKCGADFDATAKSKLVSVPRPAKSRTARTNFSRSTKPAPDKAAADMDAEAPRDKAEDEEDLEVEVDETDETDETDDAETDDAVDPAPDDDDKLAEDR